MKLHFLIDVINDIEWTGKTDNYVIFSCLNSEAACKLINRIPG